MNLYLILSVVLFAFVLISGFILRKNKAPYSKITANIHKVISLVAVVLLVFYILKDTDDFSTAAILHLTSLGILFLLALISGGFLIRKEEHQPKQISAHRISSALSFLLMGLYFVLHS